jgi:hypothetical protein
MPRSGAVAVAIVLSATATAVFRAAVVADFVPIHVGVVGAEVHSAGRAIRIALPALPQLRSHTAVLGVQVRNTGDEQREIELSLHGLPSRRIEVPPGRTVRRDIGLSPGIVRALSTEVGVGARSLLLTGDADGWALAALEIRNYHVRIGGGVSVMVVPGRADVPTSRAGFILATIVLSLFALVQALGPRSQRGWVRLVGNTVALIALLLSLTCLLLPLLSPYKVLLSPSAFALVAAGLFSPILVAAVEPLVTRMRPTLWRSIATSAAPIRTVIRRSAAVGRYWTAHAVTLERGAVLLALVAMGVAQPIFDVVSNSPEFFAARGTARATVVAATLSMCLGIPLGLLAIERAIRTLSRRAGAAFLGLAIAVLTSAIVMPWLRRGDVLRSPWEAPIAVLVGLGVALAYGRSRVVRQFFTALAPAAVIVPGMFLLEPGVRQTFRPAESTATALTIERTPPIVFVIFDELPLNSLLDAGGNIDSGRYPHFAALAREAYWFRNASTVSSLTSYAVPAVLSGRYPMTSEALPTLQFYPVNLFTTLAPHYDILASLRFQQLCPPRLCESATPADPLSSLLWDLGLVWLHIVLPPAFTETLPPVDTDWAEFGEAPAAAKRHALDGRRGVFAAFLESIDGRPARLQFIHSMLPHLPLEYVPSGRRYRGPDRQPRLEGGQRLFERASPAYADALHQRHLAQVGFVDRLVGDLIRRLRDVQAYDEALVIITADHGSSYREGRARRVPQEHNLSDIIHVPLFIKLPGQRHGEVVDRIVEAVDVLPTIFDVLGAKVSFPMDGRSVFDGQVPDRSVRTFIHRHRIKVERRAVRELSAERTASLDRKLRRFGSGDPMALYAPPGARHVLGMHVDPSALQPSAGVQITVSNPGRFAAVKRDRDPLPLYVEGILRTSKSDPLEVAIVVNGVVAAVCQSYRQQGDHVFSTLVPEEVLREGHNSVAAVVLETLSARQRPGLDDKSRTSERSQ